MRILIIRFSSMGDVILASAVFPFLQSKHPGASIHVLTRSRYAGFFRQDTRIDRVYSLEESPDCKTVCGGVWDKTIDLQNNAESRTLTDSMTAPGTVSRFDKCHRERVVLLLTRLNLYTVSRTVVVRYLEAAGAVRGDVPFFAPTIVHHGSGSESCEGVCAGLDPARPLLALVPFAAWKNKQWPLEKYRTAAHGLIDKGYSVIVLGGPDDAAGGQALAAELGPQARSAAGQLTLSQNTELLSRCALCLGNDTGLCHLARAVGVKTGIIYGSTTRHFGFFPEGEPPFRVFESRTFCRPCHAHGGNLCYRGSRPCLGRVGTAEVVKGMLSLAGSFS